MIMLRGVMFALSLGGLLLGIMTGIDLITEGVSRSNAFHLLGVPIYLGLAYKFFVWGIEMESIPFKASVQRIFERKAS